jgi:hypothetical protein
MILVLNKNNLKMLASIWFAAVGNHEEEKLKNARNNKNK